MNDIQRKFREEQWNRRHDEPTMSEEEFRKLAEQVIKENIENYASQARFGKPCSFEGDWQLMSPDECFKPNDDETKD